jgi:hypothetical protein
LIALISDEGEGWIYETPLAVDCDFVCNRAGQFKLRRPFDGPNQTCWPAATRRG